MPTCGIQACHKAAPGAGLQAHLASHPARNGSSPFIEAHHHLVTLECNRTRTDRVALSRACNARSSAFGHGPTLTRCTIERHIERTELLGGCHTTTAGARPGVVGREDTAHKGNDAQTMGAVIAQRIEIPPEIAAIRHRRIETGPARGLSAARGCCGGHRRRLG